jgi:hypothetical protein
MGGNRCANRNAIEDELQVLYDAYYEELEQYANYQQRYVSSGGTITPPPGPGPFPGSVELDKNGAVVGSSPHHSHGHHTNTKPPSARGGTKGMTNGRKATNNPNANAAAKTGSEFDDDEGEEEEYAEEEEEYEEEDEEDEEDDDDDEHGPDVMGEGDDLEDVKAQRGRKVSGGNVPATANVGARGRRIPLAALPGVGVNGVKPNGRDGLFNLTVTGKYHAHTCHRYSYLPFPFFLSLFAFSGGFYFLYARICRPR